MKNTLRTAISCVYLYSGCSRLFRALGSRRHPVTIVYYHEITDDRADDFARQIDYLQNRYPLVSLAQAIEAIRSNATRRVVTVTFDDAFRCLRANALPLLRKRRIPATVFLPTALAGRCPDWFGPVEGAFRDQVTVMTLQEAALEEDEWISFQAHSATHRDLFCLTEQELDEDFRRNKQDLQSALRSPVWAICYPAGHCDDTIRRVAARYFEVGLDSLPGITQGDDVMRLRRTDLSSIPPTCELRRRMAGSHEWQNAHRLFRRARRARNAHVAPIVQG